MIFLHNGDMKFHGNLKTSNFVDSNSWVLQLTEFQLPASHEPAFAETGSIAKHPYHEKIVLKVKQIPSEEWNAFGPQRFNLQDYIGLMMKDSWNKLPQNRLDFQYINRHPLKMKKRTNMNTMDNRMMMEKYNLEELVDKRTIQLVEEKKKMEALLNKMLPKSVANQLTQGKDVVPEFFDAVTIFYSDIVGFTKMSASSTPVEVAIFLNNLYTVFDNIISHYNVYKVSTIGDAYLVVSGLPIRNGDNHAGEIARMALELLESMQAFNIKHKPNQTLKLRIGIHTGPVAAGIIGLTMPQYCLFGDTANTASIMQSTGEEMKIQISSQCKEYLDRLGGYYTKEKGLVSIKGKGEIKTYWLVGHENIPKKRFNSMDMLPLQPLFTLHHEENIRHQSPTMHSYLEHLEALADRHNSNYTNLSDELQLQPPHSPSSCHQEFL